MVKYRNDVRYDSRAVVTHNGTKVESHVAKHLYELDEVVKEFDVICIDEIQFYADAPIFCDKWANEGRVVICCGLSGNFKREPFQVVSKLIPMVEEINFLTAICEQNGEEAPFTHRFTEEQQDEVIGGKDKYHAMDRRNYFSNNPGSAELKFLDFVNIYTAENNIKLEDDLKVKFVNYFRKHKRPYSFPQILKECFVNLDVDARMLPNL